MPTTRWEFQRTAAVSVFYFSAISDVFVVVMFVFLFKSDFSSTKYCSLKASLSYFSKWAYITENLTALLYFIAKNLQLFSFGQTNCKVTYGDWNCTHSRHGHSCYHHIFTFILQANSISFFAFSSERYLLGSCTRKNFKAPSKSVSNRSSLVV